MIGTIEVKEIPAHKLDEHIRGMDRMMREWTDRAARGECAWICSDCCMSDPVGMPDACFHKNDQCTAIIQRDKQRAMKEGNEPQ